MGSRLTRASSRHLDKETNASNNSTGAGRHDSQYNDFDTGQKDKTDRNGNSKGADIGCAEPWQQEKAASDEKKPILLPLADERIPHQEAINLLAEAKSRALCDLTTIGFPPRVDEIKEFAFPFENAVFEGGGVKGIAYIGAVKCLEDAGIKMKRFAGASIGASVAGFLSVGFSVDELVPLYLQDLSIFIRDSRFELLCFLPRLIGTLGLNPGKKFYDWFGRCIAVKTQDPDVTFRQVYDKFGTELCVIILNMNTGREEYCHPKTTPNLSIRKAIRMSISVPGVLEPHSVLHANGNSNMYIDGGVICNYPIYAFDGWWLSMSPKDTLYKNFGKLSESCCSMKSLSMFHDADKRFKEKNDKTLGFTQTSNSTFFNDRFATSADATPDIHLFSRPDTKLSRKRMKHLRSLDRAVEAQSLQRSALLKLFTILEECSNEEGFVSAGLFSDALMQGKLTNGDLAVLFGKDMTVDTLLSRLPTPPNEPNLISPTELDEYFISHGLHMHRLLEEALVASADITGLKSFWHRLQQNVTYAARRSFIKHEDLARTVNINTDYIEFLDFGICTEDKIFLMQQGYKYTFTYLQTYMLKHEKNNPATLTPPAQQPEPSLSNAERESAENQSLFYMAVD